MLTLGLGHLSNDCPNTCGISMSGLDENYHLRCNKNLAQVLVLHSQTRPQLAIVWVIKIVPVGYLYFTVLGMNEL